MNNEKWIVRNSGGEVYIDGPDGELVIVHRSRHENTGSQIAEALNDHKALLIIAKQLVWIEEAMVSGKELISNQGQALDGYSALAAFRELVPKAISAIAKASA